MTIMVMITWRVSFCLGHLILGVERYVGVRGFRRVKSIVRGVESVSTKKLHYRNVFR